MVEQGSYLAKVDLKSAYRSVPISRHSMKVTGLKWKIDNKFYYFFDYKLPFGSRAAPGIFHRLSQAVRRMMSRRGFTIVVYLDDFLICEKTKDRCVRAMVILISLLRKLGFFINWQKVVDPCQVLVFLGIEIDTTKLELRLPSDKLLQLQEELDSFMQRRRASKRQLQSLVGKLNWAAAVVYGGRVFLRRIINAFTPLKHKAHKTIITPELRADIEWWHTFMSTFNGRSLMLYKRPITTVHTDACMEGGAGAWLHDWFYCNWQMDCPSVANMHINEKEIMAIVIAALRWSKFWANHNVLVYCDNSTTVACINKGSSKNKTLMSYIRVLFWLSARNNFKIIAKHIPGKENVLADQLSWLHEQQMFHKIFNSAGCSFANHFATASHGHMSKTASVLLFRRHGSGNQN